MVKELQQRYTHFNGRPCFDLKYIKLILKCSIDLEFHDARAQPSNK